MVILLQLTYKKLWSKCKYESGHVGGHFDWIIVLGYKEDKISMEKQHKIIVDFQYHLAVMVISLQLHQIMHGVFGMVMYRFMIGLVVLGYKEVMDIDGEVSHNASGFSVSLSSDGNTVAIGAPNNDGVNGTYSGHVRFFDWNGSSWLQRGQDIDGEAAYDYSGHSVSLSNDGTLLQ